MSESTPPNGQVLQQRMLVAIDKLEATVGTMQVAVAELTLKLSYLPCQHHSEIIHRLDAGEYARTEDLNRVERLAQSKFTIRAFLAQVLGTAIAVGLGIITYLQLLN